MTKAKVRTGAVIALVNLEYEPGRQSIALHQDVSAALLQRFGREPSGAVRAEIAKSFALTATDANNRDAFLQGALDDPDGRVVEYAVMGLAQSRPAGALSRIVSLLQSRRINLRLQVAQALAAYGPSARQYVPQLQQAISTETDPTIRKSLEAAMSRITTGGPRR